MDIFDESILSVLEDGKPKLFSQLKDEVAFSHNTLKLHLKKLLKEGFVAREKTISAELGRPKFAYSIPAKLKKQVSNMLSNPSVEIVHLPFSRLKHLCRFEKGGYCKETKMNCTSHYCSQLPKDRD